MKNRLKPSHANLGRELEELINYANEQYKNKGVAIVQKIATPWKVIRRGSQIVSAFPEQKSTVDYIGLSRGRPVAFDAKQCLKDTLFPLSYIEQHQLDFLTLWEIHTGEAFWIIEMVKLGKIFKVEHAMMRYYFGVAMAGGRKSIPVADLEKFPEVTQAGGIVLDYLKLYS